MKVVSLVIDLFPDEVEIEPFEGSDDFGAPSYGDSYTVRARVKGRQTRVTDAAGQARVSMVTAILADAPGAGVLDRYTLPDRFVPRQPPAIAVNRVPDENGAHHEKVFF